MAKQKKNSVADKLQDLSKKEPIVENQEVVITKESIEEIAADDVDLSVGEPSITTYAEKGKLFVSAREAYLHAYEHFPVFPANWFIPSFKAALPSANELIPLSSSAYFSLI